MQKSNLQEKNKIMLRKSKLVLGTANFGLHYGLANRVGKVSQNELIKVLSICRGVGIEFIDTAQAYGDSESRLGALCDDGHFKMITKISSGLDSGFFEKRVTQLVLQSCKRLNQSNLYAIMLHDPEVLFGESANKIISDLIFLKDQNIVSKIGVSIYSPDILDNILKLLDIDIIQAPFNIFDQKILASGWSKKLKERGVEIHTRSVFLQGLLLMKQNNLPAYFKNNWPVHFDTWYGFLRDNRIHALEVALKFALQQDWIDKIVVGVDSVAQLETLLAIEKSSKSIDFPLLGCDDPKLINPSKWNLL